MGLIRCDAFKQHGCMKRATQAPLICCHSCKHYESCSFRCENKPRSCGRGVVTEQNLFQPAVKSKKEKIKKGKRVAQYDADTGELIRTFDSVKDAAHTFPDREFGSISACISTCARGGQRTANGYVWRYLD